ncbi:eL24 family ribosomal protein [Marinoscillum luteum]|uniref:TRASH domain-containing protein n=1 Tax=Marinoscillum luteum TaxID=861051 RepID=A0ABW7N6W6_9BACT
MVENRAYRRNQKKKDQRKPVSSSLKERLFAYIFLGSLVLIATFLGFYIFMPGIFNAQSYQPMPNKNEVLDHSFVCMVNNSYKGREMIPVFIGDKTYYGCCPSCEQKLKNRPHLYHVNDPLTGETVDKANAFITFDPKRYPRVLYFKSLQNAETYLDVDLEIPEDTTQTKPNEQNQFK